MRRYVREQIEARFLAVREFENAPLRVGFFHLVLRVVHDPFRLDHLPDGLGDLRAGDAHGPGLRRIEIDLCPLSDVPLSAMVLEEHRRLVRGRRALVRRRRREDHEPPARESGQRVSKRLGTGQRVEVVTGRGETRYRLRRQLGAERDDEEVGGEHAAVHDGFPLVGVDSLDLTEYELDALSLQARKRARDLVCGAAAGHEPEERGREDEGRFAFDEDDAVLLRQRLAQLVRRHQPTHSAAQDQHGL